MAENKAKPMEMRDAFGKTLLELGLKDEHVIVLDADLNTSSKAVYFKQRFPDRFIQAGIAEQNLFGLSAGLALTGLTPFPCTFASFAARRALDQIAISICYPKLNVKIPGSYVGIPTSRAGASHDCIEDIAVMRSLPNMRVADPGDNQDLHSLMHLALETPGPVYFRVTRYTLPDLFESNHQFAWGKGQVLRQGTDVTLFGTGMMTGLCLQAAELLAKRGYQARVVHLGSIKPIDEELVTDSAHTTGCAVTAENASVIGGLGAAVCDVVCRSVPIPVERIGVHDHWVNSGSIDELMAYYHMRPLDIMEAAERVIKAKERAG